MFQSSFLRMDFFSVHSVSIIPVNTLRKSNVILGLYFGNLRKLLSINVMLRNLNYVRNPNVVITLAQPTQILLRKHK